MLDKQDYSALCALSKGAATKKAASRLRNLARIADEVVSGSLSDILYMNTTGDEIGSGAYAAVYDNGDDTVTKVMHIRLRDHKLDPYLHYLRIVRKNMRLPENIRDKRMPRVFKVQLLVNDYITEETTLMIQMEKLYSIDDFVIDGRRGMLRYSRLKEVVLSLGKLARAGLIGPINKIKDIQPSARIDFHTGNVMLRKEGNTVRLVVTDPVAP